MIDLTDALADTQAREAEWREIAAANVEIADSWSRLAEAWAKVADAQRSATPANQSAQAWNAQRTRSHILILAFVIMAMGAAIVLSRSLGA